MGGCSVRVCEQDAGRPVCTRLTWSTPDGSTRHFQLLCKVPFVLYAPSPLYGSDARHQLCYSVGPCTLHLERQRAKRVVQAPVDSCFLLLTAPQKRAAATCTAAVEFTSKR